MLEPNVSLGELLSDLRGFMIEENEDVITVTSSGKDLSIRLSNICTDDEITSLILCQDKTGVNWIQSIKIEILARSIVKLNDVPITRDSVVVHPLQTDANGETKIVPAVTAIRDIIRTWGQEFVTVLWKAAMVHRQRIEDRLLESFPDTALFVKAEERFLEQIKKEIDAANNDLIADA